MLLTVIVENINNIMIWILMFLGWAGFFTLLWFVLRRKTFKSKPASIPTAGQANFSKGISNEELLSVLTLETDNLVAVTDHLGNIIYINESFQYTLGFSSIANEVPKSLFDFEGFDKIYDIFQDSTERKQNIQTEIFVTNDRGQRYWLQVSFSHAISGDEQKVVIIATNINDLKYAEEEISQQREELMVQSEQLEAMNTELEHVNQVTTDSINYAQRIQYAILPREDDYLKYLESSFVFFRPRDIVSGDFYWYGEVENKAFYVEADCTGHGVPGALMATIGNTLLNEVVISEKVFNPALVLKELDRKVKAVLRQESGVPSQQDGMDMTFVQYDYENQELSFSMANQFMYFYHDGELHEIEGSLFAIGGTDIRNVQPDFDLHRFKVKKNDILYLFSDGYRDQFNEDESEKLMRHRFRSIIERITSLEMSKQKEMLEENFDKWRSTTRQIDDILVWGLKF